MVISVCLCVCGFFWPFFFVICCHGRIVVVVVVQKWKWKKILHTQCNAVWFKSSVNIINENFSVFRIRFRNTNPIGIGKKTFFFILLWTAKFTCTIDDNIPHGFFSCWWKKNENWKKPLQIIAKYYDDDDGVWFESAITKRSTALSCFVIHIQYS